MDDAELNVRSTAGPGIWGTPIKAAGTRPWWSKRPKMLPRTHTSTSAWPTVPVCREISYLTVLLCSWLSLRSITWTKRGKPSSWLPLSHCYLPQSLPDIGQQQGLDRALNPGPATGPYQTLKTNLSRPYPLALTLFLNRIGCDLWAIVGSIVAAPTVWKDLCLPQLTGYQAGPEAVESSGRPVGIFLQPYPESGVNTNK